MEKILIITEGHTEQIFIKNILLNIFLQDQFSIRCIKLISDSFENSYSHNPPTPIIHFEIINVQNDQKVLSFILENEKNYFKNGYNRIIGLRDMYCEEYTKFSNCYKEELNVEFEENSKKAILGLENHLKIKIYFAVMEIEAWFLAMFRILEKFDVTLKPEYILDKINFDIKKINPEKIFRPTKVISTIYDLVNKKYNKSRSCAEGITNNITCEDFNLGIENDRCKHLECFFNEIISYNLPVINK